ncbi:hybrid sensor histidine kinase/response regulator [Azorhizobium oxalatiphilum]|uniref:hybrid sensor histidine kinase/response regulator n=1 Tax=Azorhizobium oxalatiphilum TaxID=980631 RepID=UPI001FCE4318|nr:ATP-binding protein [Azorhizobium oxalatiphilum]
MATSIDDSTGAILVTEEALSTDLGALNRALEGQPSWSDVPFVLLAGRQPRRQFIAEAVRRRLPDSAINVILLERPLSSESLISAIGAAMRARQKQFEMRDRLAQLDAQQARLVTLLDNLPVGVAFINPDGSTLLSNPAFRRFLPSGDVPSRQSDGPERWIGHEEDGTRITRERFVAARALRGEAVLGTEFRYHAPPEPDVWTRVSGIPLKTPDSDVAGAIAVIVDIDEQKRAQETLAGAAQKLEQQVAQRTAELEETLAQLRAEAQQRELAQAALRQAQKMEAVGQLTGGIAHDFNNMLTGIIGAIDVMRRRIAANRTDDLDRFMEAAYVSAQRAAGLTQRLLAFSRRQSLDSRPTDINALVLSLEDLLRRTMSERIDVRISVTPDLPAALVDANQLESAILNLAINARDAMPDGGQLTVKTRPADLGAADCTPHPGMKPGRYVVVTVSDTGVGMDTAVLEKVFDPFFTTKPVGQGTGLGLSMVYGFAKQSNGQVRIKSQPGAGTQVQILLPATQQAQPPERIAPQAVIEGSGQTVLLVEDDASVRLLVRDVLEELGYAAMEAAEPSAAVQLLETGHRFDLMVSDVGLPGMNGRQLAEIARQHLPEIPILFITGYAENAALRAGFLGTNMAMITKPFQIEDLSAKISEMLR